MARLRNLAPLVRTRNTSTVVLPGKRMDPVYNSPAYRVWRRQVVSRAGARCEARDHHGLRCTNAWPEHRMYADHIVELFDGGSLTDLRNGQCLCSRHHHLKTYAARARRVSTLGGVPKDRARPSRE